MAGVPRRRGTPPVPAGPSVEEGILRGIHRFRAAPSAGAGPRVQLLSSGTAVHRALEAQELPAAEWGVRADVWSVTSWTELRRDALRADAARLRGEERVPYVTRALAGAPGPVPAVSDRMRQVPDRIGRWVEQDYASLGTDGFGLGDTREAVRHHFGVERASIAVAALDRPAGPDGRGAPGNGRRGPCPVRTGELIRGAGRARRTLRVRGPRTRPARGRAWWRRLVAW